MGGENQKPGFADPRAAQAAGQLTQARARQAKEDPDAYVEDKLARERPYLIDELLAAARGRGKWSDLSPEKRLAALIKALEYAAGRPGQAPKSADGTSGGAGAPNAPAPTAGLTVA